MADEQANRFNIRVYALIVNDYGQILLSDEYVLNMQMTKFPGGGMHFGEGPMDCLRREAIEEFGQEIDILAHYYTTHFFQPAMFLPDQQLISIYYKARLRESPRFKISTIPFDFTGNINGSQSFRWEKIETLQAAELTFPVDRYVLSLLQSK